MAIHPITPAQFNRPGPQTMKVTTLPAPTGGMDSRQNLADEQLDLCLFSYNLNPAEYGMAVRQGYRRYQTDVQDVASDGVRTIIPYAGLAQDGLEDRLFAVTNEGIFDVTTENGTPSLSLTFADQTGEAGYGVYTAYVTDAEVALVFYADRVNGLFTYDPGTDTWAQTTGLTGLDETLVSFVTVHKQRLWLAIQGEATAYYLAVASIAGNVKPFYFGSKFAHGGELVGLYNWTVDGGEGVNDHLVAVSRGGDVLPYVGSDPESNDWSNIGTFFIGEIPRGNKIGSEFGGDLLLLSEFGVTAMSDLLRSSTALDLSSQSITFKIAALIRRELRELKDALGWELRYIPTQALLILQTPLRSATSYQQFILLRTTQGWCYWRDVPMTCIDAWRGAAVFGTAANTVERMDVARDAVNIETDDEGVQIGFSILGNFTSLGDRGLYKRCEFIRPTFIGSEPVTFSTKAFYDYQIDEAMPPPVSPAIQGGLWNAGIWDLDVWATKSFNPEFDVRGALGIGRTIGAACAGYGTTGTYLVSVDLGWRTGGFL